VPRNEGRGEETKHFCVVTTECIDTNYVVQNCECKIVHYEGASRSDLADCAPGTPMFVSR
jgi:hypothetical protein